MTEMIRFREVVHLPMSFNLISLAPIIAKDVKVESVNRYSLILYKCHVKLIATAPWVNGLFVLDRAPELTEYTNIDDSCLLAFKTSGHASRHDAEKQML
jgi:hypothetical protein